MIAAADGTSTSTGANRVKKSVTTALTANLAKRPSRATPLDILALSEMQQQEQRTGKLMRTQKQKQQQRQQEIPAKQAVLLETAASLEDNTIKP